MSQLIKTYMEETTIAVSLTQKELARLITCINTDIRENQAAKDALLDMKEKVNPSMLKHLLEVYGNILLEDAMLYQKLLGVLTIN